MNDALSRIASWLEGPLHPVDGAPRAALVAVAERVAAWCQKRLALDSTSVWAAAYGQARAAIEALTNDPRERFVRVAVRQLVKDAARATRIMIEEERAGRMDHVHAAGELSRPRDAVVWWGFVGGTRALNGKIHDSCGR